MQSNIEMDFGMEINQAVPEGVSLPGSLLQNLTGLSSALQTALGNINPLLKNTNKDLSQLTQNLNLFSDAAGNLISTLSGAKSLLSLSDKKTGKHKKTLSNDVNGYSAEPSIDTEKMPTSGMGFLKTGVEIAATDAIISEKMSLAGVSKKDILLAQKTALADQMNIPGSTEAGNLNALYNLYKLFKNMPEAIQVLKSGLPAAIRANKNTEGSDDDIGQFIYVAAEASQTSSKLINPKTKVADQSFASDFANGMAIMALASNGKIDAGAFDKMFKGIDRSILDQMGTAAGAEALMPLVVALKGKNVASALAALPNLFNGTQMSAQEAGGLQKIGISPASLAANKNTVQWASWVENVLIPDMDKHGYTSGSAQAGFLKQLAGNKNISALMPLLNQLTAIETNAQAYKAVKKDPTDTYSSIAKNNILLNSRALVAATDSLAGTLAKLASPDGTAMLRGLTDFMNTLDKLAVENPKIAKVVLELGAVGGAIAFLYKPLKSIIGLINKLRGNKGQDDASIPCCCCEDGGAGGDAGEVAKALAEGGVGLFLLRLKNLLGFKGLGGAKSPNPAEEPAYAEDDHKVIPFRKPPAIKFRDHAPEEIAGKSPEEVSEVAKSAIDKVASAGEGVAEAGDVAVAGDAIGIAEIAGGTALTIATGGADLGAVATIAAFAALVHYSANPASIVPGLHKEKEKIWKRWNNFHPKFEHDGRFGRYYYGEDDNGETPVKPAVKLKPKVNIDASEGDGLPNIPEDLAEKMQLPWEEKLYQFKRDNQLDDEVISASVLYSLSPTGTRILVPLPVSVAPQPPPAPAKAPMTSAELGQPEPSMPMPSSALFHGAMPVWIVNSGDLHNATVRAISSEWEGVQYGPTGYDGSFSPAIPSGYS